ncbi:MAG TPA: FAD-dependent oxidoreductase, partial [Propylenella sp.]
MRDQAFRQPLEDVRPSSEIPATADVVIIGGGIVGVSAAFFLAARGVRTVLCEKGAIAGEQSSRNWGWVRRMGRDPRELPLIMESIGLWSSMRQLIGEDVGYRASGILYLAATDAELARRESWLARAGDHVLDTRALGRNELDALIPGASGRYVGALYTPSDGRAEPQKAAPAIARAAQRRGAAVLTRCAVRGIETTGGRVSAVVTERGSITCATVVLAGGVWSSLFCRSLGIRLPQLAVRASVMRTAPMGGGPEIAVATPDFAFRKRADGGYTIAGRSIDYDIVPDSFRYFVDFLPVLKLEWRRLELRLGDALLDLAQLGRAWRMDGVSPFERRRVLDPDPVAKHLDGALAALQSAFPAFRGATIEGRWAGLIDATPDTVPVISGTPLSGFLIATGFSGHGFGLGPGAG